MSSSPRPALTRESSIEIFEYPAFGTHKGNTSAPPNGDAREHGGDVDLPRLLAEAKAQGMQEGLQQAQRKAADEGQRYERIAEAIRNFQERSSGYYSRVEVELVHLALAIAGKILHREAQVDRMLMAGLAKVAIQKLQQGTRVIVRVNPQGVQDWKEYLKSNLSGWMNVEVESDNTLALQNCILDTELGVTELGIEAQIKEVERGFFDLLAQRPASK